MSADKSSAERSRFPEFYKLSVNDRVRVIHERGWLSAEDYQALISGEHTLKIHKADKMIENVVGVMGLPVGLGLNFLVNGRDYIVPLVVEESSIVAALSSAAKVVRGAGGFSVDSTEPVLSTVKPPVPRTTLAAEDSAATIEGSSTTSGTM